MTSSSVSNNNSLKRLGQILKIPVHKVSDIKHLRYQLDELCESKLVLIDTAGLRYGDPALKQQLSVLRQLPQVKNILVLAANTQLQLMKASVHAFRAADLRACVLTKVDDTISLGEAFSAILQEQLPVAYTSSGQDFTKDIQVARAHQIVARAVSLLKSESKHQLCLRVENTRKPALLNR
jgi:flagellar biosynthesis protein FlhF